MEKNAHLKKIAATDAMICKGLVNKIPQTKKKSSEKAAFLMPIREKIPPEVKKYSKHNLKQNPIT